MRRLGYVVVIIVFCYSYFATGCFFLNREEQNEFHTKVEQSQIKKSGFKPEQIHNTSNIIAIDRRIHAKISGYYKTTSFEFTEGLSVRDWLAGKSFEYQYDFGIDVLRSFGVII